MPRPTSMSLLVFCLLLGFLAPSAYAAPETYRIDHAHSSVTFEVRHFLNAVPGRFKDFEGTVIYDPESPDNSSVEILVQAESVDTDLERRDEHIRSADFLEAETYPEISFRSTNVAAKDAETLLVTGDFSLRGKTQRLTVPVTFLGLMDLGKGLAKAAFETELVIDRQDFGVKWNRVLDTGGTVLGDEVKIRIVLQLDRLPSTSAATSDLE